MRYFVYFSYKGTAYHGWQRQGNALTVQEVLEDAFQLILRQRVPITGAGRTDTGVHASMMVGHFDWPMRAEEREAAETAALETKEAALPNNFASRLNNLLPRDITVHNIRAVQPDTHARFSAVKRQYKYFCMEHKTPYFYDLVTRIPKNLDFERMNQAAALLLATRDFASFCKLHTDVKTTLCHVTRADWQQQGEQWVFTIEADRFLRNMVRAIVGTLFEVRRGRMSIEQFQQIIDRRQREAAGQSAPAEGLYLTQVEYPEEVFL